MLANTSRPSTCLRTEDSMGIPPTAMPKVTKSTSIAAPAGVGGLKSSCGEENLLRLPFDQYHEGEDMCTNECSHELMKVGFKDRQRREIEQVYRSSTSKGFGKALTPQ